ncbi:Bifunctional protein GlmU [Asimina triloba]
MEFTLEQLKQFDGSDESKPIYVGVKGRVFDVSAGKSFYGPGGPYCIFAGKEASRALAKMSKNEEDVCASLESLTEKEMGVLNDWERKFEAKYPVVGRVTPLRAGAVSYNTRARFYCVRSKPIFI